MKKTDLSRIPLLVKEGIISQKQGIDWVAIFITKNPPLFSLQKYSEDFRSEIVLSIIEKGPILFDSFDVETGSFFTYLYTFIQNIIFSIKKKNAKFFIKENINLVESINSFTEKEHDYSCIDYNKINKKVPFKKPDVTENDLRIAFNIKSKNTLKYLQENNGNQLLIQKVSSYSAGLVDKTILVLALKSAFFITDEQIELVSKICKIDSDVLFFFF